MVFTYNFPTFHVALKTLQHADINWSRRTLLRRCGDAAMSDQQERSLQSDNHVVVPTREGFRLYATLPGNV